ncbi:hypothetical protein F5X99DRAFT_421888 [Biscogniauxia marginata]|nr:hypothetical protein F5X99DRAFT_421888 [Biscogniauxia marginata]
MSSHPLYLGFDLSTQQLKAIVIQSDLKVVSQAKVDFDADFAAKYKIKKGVQTNDDEGEVFAPVAMWVEAAELVLNRLRDNGCSIKDIRGISGSGQQHSSVYWNKDAEPALKQLDSGKTLIEQLSHVFSYEFAPSWQDHSTQAECDLFDAHLGTREKLAEVTGSAAHHRFTGTQILRMRRRRPEVYASTARISLASSFLASIFLGAIAPIDISDVTGMNLWDIAAETWNEKLLELTATKEGVPELRKKLGDVPIDGGKSLGSISPYFVHRFGFSPDCQIAPFTGDNPATILSLPLRPLDAIVSLGTSSTFLMNTPHYKPDPSYHFMNHPTNKNHFMFMLCYKNGGLAREQVRDRLPKPSGPDPWANFNKHVLETPPLDIRKEGDRAKLGLYFPLPEIVPNVRAGTWRYTCNPDGSGLAESAGGADWGGTGGAATDARVIVESQALSMRLRSHNLVRSPPGRPGLPPQPRRVYLVGGGSLNPAIARAFGDVLGGADGVYRLDVGGNACALGGAYKALWALERRRDESEGEGEGEGEGETFDDLIGRRWREDEAVRKVDDGFRDGVGIALAGPVSYLDCIAFCIFLAPQLLIHVGLFETVFVVLRCLPFLLFELPHAFIHERFFVQREKRSPFVRQASPFEDFVVRCVRYAFANIPPKVGRVFFSKPVALPFLRFRMLRHGYLKSPVHWNEYRDVGIWIIQEPMQKPDVCVFYAHGGGFSMGSSYFYLEFLITWLSLLGNSGYQNPAIFALEYTLVPDSCFPTQLQEAVAGYSHVLSMIGDPDRICVSGDSAGAAVVLSLLLHLANLNRHSAKIDEVGTWHLAKPGMAVLISPWVTLVSDKHRNTASDYLDAGRLHIYARQYSGEDIATDDPLLSPGNCRDVEWWRKACPSKGMHMAYGAEEVFAPEIENLAKFLKENGVNISSRAAMGGIHAWPVASLFLSNLPEDRQKGLTAIVQKIRDAI